MQIKRLLATAIVSGALALPGVAFAQATTGGGAGGGAGAGGGGGGSNTAATTSGGNGGNYGTQTLPSQRITNTGAGEGQGAALVISGSGVREVQQALNRLGYAAGPVTGNWDKDTQRAMAEFQAAHGLDPTGNLDISSIAALGLWSRLIGNPLGNGNQSLVSNATGAPPPRGNVGGGEFGGGYGGGYGAGGPGGGNMAMPNGRG